MTGTLVNVVAVIIGGSVGLALNRNFPEKIQKGIFDVLGLFTVFLGVNMALGTSNMLILIFSMLCGVISGEWLKLESAFSKMSNWLRRKVKSKNERFSEGLISAFLLFCVGAMTITGAIEEGLGQKPNLLMTKSLMDGFSSIALASAMGAGVIFSSIPLLIFQGGLTLLAFQLKDFMTATMIAEITAAGGIIMIGLGINILNLKKLRITNMLPALIFAAIFEYLNSYLEQYSLF
jgi:hypothetical protein